MKQVRVLRVVGLDLREVLVRESFHRGAVRWAFVPRVARPRALIVVPEPLAPVAGHAVGAPVNEDAELHVVVPVRQGALDDLVPLRLVAVQAACAHLLAVARRVVRDGRAERVAVLQLVQQMQQMQAGRGQSAQWHQRDRPRGRGSELAVN